MDPITVQVLAQRPARGRRGDGGSARAQRVLAEHHRTPRLQHGDLRPDGAMIAQSASIPVHLGRCPDAVRR